jgi:ABC-type transport system substrate-binding protein
MFDMVVFNTRRPLFRTVRLRQAVEYALDRPAMARAFWDAPGNERVVQLPGYGPGHVYPLSGSDLRASRRLAGQKRRRAVLLIPGDLGPSAAADVLRSNLGRIGIAVRIVHVGGSDQKTVVAAFGKADMIIGTSLQCSACERDPAPFFRGVLQHGLFGSPLPRGPWSAPAAPLAVYGSFQYGEYFGARVGCKRFPPFQQGVDLGALCVQSP